MNHGKLFLIIGPSGVGKGTVINLLKKKYKEKFVFPISATTRPMRPHEKEGETYYFLTEENFRKKIEEGEFLEWARVHNQNYYGTLKRPIFEALEAGKSVVRELDIQGFQSIQKILSSDQFVSIFLLPPSLEILKKRILKRAPLSEEELQERMKSAEKELEKSKECHYRVQTQDGDIPGTVREVENILEKELQNTEI